jgi:phosphoribosylformylglycinamidine synthase II
VVKDVYRIEVLPLPGEGQPGYLLGDIAALGVEGVERVERHDLYFLAGDLAEGDLEALIRELLADPVVHRAEWRRAGAAAPAPEGAVRVEVGYLPGVTDSVAANLVARARLLGMAGLEAAASAQAYLLYGDLREGDVHTITRRLLANDVIQYYQIGALTPHVGNPPPAPDLSAREVPLRALGEEGLLALSRDRLLALDLVEMRAIQDYFTREGREPTDVELESLAQTWSEHCVHKTFKGTVHYTETVDGETRRETIDSLIRTYLKAATDEIAAPWVRSAFVDNAGIVEYDGVHEVSFKVETHNHPSALEPFGGANTGVGGVVRDVMGVSARPIANTDVLCFGPLDTPQEDLPTGVLHPRRIYNGVLHGVEDYGNKMGIPTVNGAILFDPGYTANPLVYCGCLGIAPLGAHPRNPQPGDLVVVLGGRTGRDGIHGATFSSIELTDETGVTSGGAVQIGNPITEKMVLDALLVARDEGLYTAITDCGAGGLSSAVSEMGEETGVRVDLERVPLKYHGLQPWEIWLSESQERMVLAVPPAHEARLGEICRRYGVEMTVIGALTGDRRLHLTYGDAVVADLAMEFLHDGLPCRVLEAAWREPALPARAGAPLEGAALGDMLLEILAHPNVRSKEDVVRRYDHEVQGATVVKPFVGVRDDAPADAAVLRPAETEGWRGLAVGCGFNPAYGAIDPYAMAVSAIDEAVRNVVAVGADPERIAILDNFCWGNPLKPDRLGDLVRACRGCHDGAVQYGAPFISGKDSLNNEYLDQATGQQVSIPPSLLISALGIVPDVRRAVTSDLKSNGNVLYLLGETRRELGGSYYYRLRGLQDRSVPGVAAEGPAIARTLHRAIAEGLVSSCHDLSEGGLGVAAAEMVLGGRCGAELRLGDVRTDLSVRRDDDWRLFSESNGRYLVEVTPRNAVGFERLWAASGLTYGRLGHTTTARTLKVYGGTGRVLFDLSVERLRAAWNGHIHARETQEERHG